MPRHPGSRKSLRTEGQHHPPQSLASVLRAAVEASSAPLLVGTKIWKPLRRPARDCGSLVAKVGCKGRMQTCKHGWFIGFLWLNHRNIHNHHPLREIQLVSTCSNQLSGAVAHWRRPQTFSGTGPVGSCWGMGSRVSTHVWLKPLLKGSTCLKPCNANAQQVALLSLAASFLLILPSCTGLDSLDSESVKIGPVRKHNFMQFDDLQAFQTHPRQTHVHQALCPWRDQAWLICRKGCTLLQ
jgi:hypothetical protein